MEIGREVRALDVAKLITLTEDEIEKLMRANQAKVKAWTRNGATQKL